MHIEAIGETNHPQMIRLHLIYLFFGSSSFFFFLFFPGLSHFITYSLVEEDGRGLIASLILTRASERDLFLLKRQNGLLQIECNCHSKCSSSGDSRSGRTKKTPQRVKDEKE